MAICLPPIAMTVPSPHQDPPGSLPGGSRPPQVAPQWLAASALRCILCSNSLGGKKGSLAGADLAARVAESLRVGMLPGHFQDSVQSTPGC